MREQRSRTRGGRRLATAVICGTTALALMGGSMPSATAATAGTTTGCVSGSTSVVDLSGSGTGLVNIGSTAGVVGVGGTGSGLDAGVLGCTVTGTVTGGRPATSTPVPSATGVPSAPSVPATTPAAPASPGAPSTAVPATGTAQVEEVRLSASATTVYPAKDGYKDSVRFSIRALDVAHAGVAVTGRAVLSKHGRTVRTWPITGATRTLSWNGKVGRTVKAGLYKLAVTVRSADGTERTATTVVQVSSKRLRTAVVTTRSTLKASAITATLPARVAKALRTGPVAVRIRTVADVRGPAELVFSNKGVTRTLVLRDGTHTTKAMPVPQGFRTVRIGRHWKAGDVVLKSVKSVWTYTRLG